MTIDTEAAKAALVAQMQALGLTPEDLVDHYRDGAPTPITVAQYIDDVVNSALCESRRGASKSAVKVIKEGMPGLCSCVCDACMIHFCSDSQWTPCPCVTAGQCSCRYVGAGKGRVAATSCLTACPVLGDRPLRSVTVTGWTELQYWVEARASKRTVSRNRKRSRLGQPLVNHEGRCAVETLFGVISEIYKRAHGNVPGVTRNLRLDMNKRARLVTEARSYNDEQLRAVWNAIYTSGGKDPELDSLLFWFQLETGSRSGGPIGLKVDNLKFHSDTSYLGEKGDGRAEQPISEELLKQLLRHALTRGDIIATNEHEIPIEQITVEDIRTRRVRLQTGLPVFYYKPKRQDDGTLKPHPITRRHFDHLWARLRKELPWLEEMHGRPHDLRITMGTVIERNFGHAVARTWLRHAVANTTDTYTKARPEEMAMVHTWMTEQPRPTSQAIVGQ